MLRKSLFNHCSIPKILDQSRPRGGETQNVRKADNHYKEEIQPVERCHPTMFFGRQTALSSGVNMLVTFHSLYSQKVPSSNSSVISWPRWKEEVLFPKELFLLIFSNVFKQSGNYHCFLILCDSSYPFFIWERCQWRKYDIQIGVTKSNNVKTLLDKESLRSAVP